MPAIQPFSSSPPPLPALIRQNKKVLPSKQMLVLRSPSVRGGHRELPRRSLLLLWHLGVAHGRHRDLGREDTVTCRNSPVQSPSAQPPPLRYCLQLHWQRSQLGLGKGETRKQGPPNRQNSSLRESRSTGLLQQKCLDCVHQRSGNSCPSRSKMSCFPPCSWNSLGGRGTLEVSCQTTSLKQD